MIMEQIVEKITQDLLQKLPEQTQSFTPDELLSSGIPYIVVETLRKNVASTVESELSIPESEWLQWNHENVQIAWQDFVDISRQHLQVPESKLSLLLTEAVEKCLELAVKPRQAVPEIIFRTHDMIDLKTAKKRVLSIEVNKQLGVALLRYMEKKGKEEIEFEQARKLIEKVDERLVEDYHPLKWAQALKPVFDLAGPAVEPELFRMFFKDKEKPAYAIKFAQLEEPLNESEFIEALSSADVLDVEGYEDDQPELFVPVDEDPEPEKVVEIDETPDEEKVISSDEEELTEERTEEEEFSTHDVEDVDEQDTEPPFEEDQTEPLEEPEVEKQESSEEEDLEEHSPEEDEKRDENIVNLFSKIREVDHVEREDDSKPVISLVKDEDDDEDTENEDNITLLSKFMFDESNEESFSGEEEEDEPEARESSLQKEPTSIYDEMNLVQDDGINRQREEEFFDEGQVDEESDEEEFSFKIESEEDWDDDSDEDYPVEKEQINIESDEEEEDQPMWRSFLERDDLETDSGYEYDEEEENAEIEELEEDEDEDFIEEPIYDLTTEDQDYGEKISKISDWMDDDKDRFVDEIFMGSEFAYEQALADITDFENWKAASMYLESEVFSRNKIDVYDEVAVDFTDRLHSYFIENNSNHDD